MKIAKKVCLIGRFAVGKTSLVKQYIDQQFSEKYKTTVGVSISTKEINIEDIDLSMIIWDIAGFEHDNHYAHYLRGVHGVIWVLDGTEPESFKVLDDINRSVPEICQVPCIYFINKHDIVDEWIVTEKEIEKFNEDKKHVLNCSAKTGENVENGFKQIAQLMIG